MTPAGGEAPRKALVIFSAYYPPNMGGIEQFTLNLAHEVASEGTPVVVVTNDAMRVGPYETQDDGVVVYRLPCLPIAGGRFPIPRRNRVFRDIFARLDEVDPLGVLINARFYFHTLMGCSYAHRKGLTPLVLDHGSTHLAFGNSRVVDWAVEEWEHAITVLVKRRKPNFYGISERSLEWIRHFGIEGCGVLSNAIDAEAFRAMASGRDFRSELGIPDGALMAAFTGRLLPTKGTTALLHAAREMMAQGRDVHILIAGDGPERERMERERTENLHMLGRLERGDVVSLLAGSDLFLFPSDTEGMATSLLEAGACGLPILSTDVGGAREVMPDDSYGIVIPAPADQDEVVRRLAWCDDHRDELKAMGTRAKARVEQEFSWQKTASDVLAACEAARRGEVR